MRYFGRVMNRHRTLLLLSRTAELLASALAAAPSLSERRAGSGGFSVTEHLCHLADLEREGFALRLLRLLVEASPVLADFDGARVAAERNYAARDPREALHRFCEARRLNLSRLFSMSEEDWTRWGTQDGVGKVTLSQLPARMAAHDAAHLCELAVLVDGPLKQRLLAAAAELSHAPEIAAA
jgi:hypothetical protein